MTGIARPTPRRIYLALLILVSALLTLLAVLAPLMRSALGLTPREGKSLLAIFVHRSTFPLPVRS